MLKQLWMIFSGLSVLGVCLIVSGVFVDDLIYWHIVDAIMISIFASSAIVFYITLRKIQIN